LVAHSARNAGFGQKRTNILFELKAEIERQKIILKLQKNN